MTDPETVIREALWPHDKPAANAKRVRRALHKAGWRIVHVADMPPTTVIPKQDTWLHEEAIKEAKEIALLFNSEW